MRSKKIDAKPLPQEWEVVEMGDFLLESPSYGINAPAVARDSSKPTYIRITDITEDGRYSPDPPVSVDHPNYRRYTLEKGDIVFARTGASVGKSYLYDPSDGDLVYAGFLIKVKPNKKELLPEFLSYSVQTKRYWNWVQSVSMRSGQPGVNGAQYSQFTFPLPPLPEQRAIAEALSDVDALIERLDALIAKKRAVKTATMQQLLTGQQRLPGFDGAWETRRLGEVATIIPGQSPSSSTYNSEGRGTPLINGPTEFTQLYPIKTQWTTSPLKLSEPGDLLLCVRGSSTGRTNVADDVYCLGRGVAAIRAENDINDRYMAYKVRDGIQSLLKLSKGSTFPSVDRSDIQSLDFSLPPQAEQRAIATTLSDMDAEIEALEARRNKTQNIKQGMMQELLTGRTRLV